MRPSPAGIPALPAARRAKREGGEDVKRIRPAVTCTSSSTCSLVSSIEQTLLEDIRALGSMHPVQRLESPEGKQRLQTDIVEHVRFVVGRNNGDPEEIANVLFHEIITTSVR